MKTIITPEQVEFRNSFFSIIYPKQHNLRVMLGVNLANLSWTDFILVKVEDIKDIDSLEFCNVAASKIESDDRIIKFHKGLLSRLYYYLMLDFLFDFDIFLKNFIGARFSLFQLTAARTMQFGVKSIGQFLQELKANGYNVDKDLLLFEKLVKLHNRSEKNLYKIAISKKILLTLALALASLIIIAILLSM
jgi:hypothetical protein